MRLNTKIFLLLSLIFLSGVILFVFNPGIAQALNCGLKTYVGNYSSSAACTSYCLGYCRSLGYDTFSCTGASCYCWDLWTCADECQKCATDKKDTCYYADQGKACGSQFGPKCRYVSTCDAYYYKKTCSSGSCSGATTWTTAAADDSSCNGKTCKGSGTCACECNKTSSCICPGSSTKCGTKDCDYLDTTCRNYYDVNRYCDGNGSCAAGTCNSYTNASYGTKCGTCKICNGSGSCNLTPADDSACGTIDCDGLDSYYQSGTESPTDTESCFYENYSDITTNRCKSFGTCKVANSSDCTSPLRTLQYSCGTCKYISSSNCTGGTKGSCSNYAKGTSCGTNKECDGKGNCVSCASPTVTISASKTNVGTGEQFTISVTGYDDNDIWHCYCKEDAGSWDSQRCAFTQTSCTKTWNFTKSSPGTYTYYGKVVDSDDAHGCANYHWSSTKSVEVTVCKSNGDPCTTASECRSGYCVDGYCCNMACNGTCMHCNYTPGTCTYVGAGQDPANECYGTGTCGGTCNGSDACQFPAAGTKCGTCKTCNGSGSCNLTPADDSACGTIDCDGLDSYYQSGTESPIDTESCFYENYSDITTNRCKSFGTCKVANSSDCTSPLRTLQYSCGTCKYISSSNCTGGTKGSCSNYAKGTSCGTNKECDDSGNCVTCYYPTGSISASKTEVETGETFTISITGKDDHDVYYITYNKDSNSWNDGNKKKCSYTQTECTRTWDITESTGGTYTYYGWVQDSDNSGGHGCSSDHKAGIGSVTVTVAPKGCSDECPSECSGYDSWKCDTSSTRCTSYPYYSSGSYCYYGCSRQSQYGSEWCYCYDKEECNWDYQKCSSSGCACDADCQSRGAVGGYIAPFHCVYCGSVCGWTNYRPMELPPWGSGSVCLLGTDCYIQAFYEDERREDCIGSATRCQLSKCPSVYSSVYNGDSCTVRRSDCTGFWTGEFGLVSRGVWDAYESKCIECDYTTHKETAVCGDTTKNYQKCDCGFSLSCDYYNQKEDFPCNGTGDNQCEWACGASQDCDEKNPGDNCGIGKTCNDSCQCVAPPPDLVIDDFWDYSGTIRYTIRNQGEGNADYSYTALYIDGTYTEYDYVASLSAGSSSYGESFSYDWKANCTDEADLIQVCADYYGPRVDEEDETNNCYGETWDCDNTPPITTISPNGKDWVNYDVGFTLTCTDEAGGSGCKTTEYKIIDTSQICNISGLTAGTSGIVTCPANQACRKKVCFRSIDNAGNEEGIQTSNLFKIDKAAPTTE